MAKESQECEKFVPSKELAEIIYDNMIKPTDEELAEIKNGFGVMREKLSSNDFQSFTTKSLSHLSAFISTAEKKELDQEMKQSMLGIIEKEIYGMLTSFAKHCLYCLLLIDGCALIAKNEKFISWAFLDIIDRFELNTEKELSPVFDRLYRELVEFYAIPKEYVWGRVAVENGELKVFVSDNAFQSIKFPIGGGENHGTCY